MFYNYIGQIFWKLHKFYSFDVYKIRFNVEMRARYQDLNKTIK